MNFIPDMQIRVHIGYDSNRPVEREKAILIAKYLAPHLQRKGKEYEKMVDKFLELPIEDLEEAFNTRIGKLD